MSTRGSIYYHDRDEHSPDIHIYEELMDERPYNIRMEIRLDGVDVNIVLPVDLQRLMGIGEVWHGGGKCEPSSN